MNIISNCPLCEQKSLHVIGEGKLETQQCIHCGYVTADKFKYPKTSDGRSLKENLKAFQELPEEMKKYHKDANDRFWIPTTMALPFGILYPFDDKDGNMKWAFAKMTPISEDKRKDFPVPGTEKDPKYYDKKYDTDNPEVYDEFVFAMKRLNDVAKLIVENEHGSKVTDKGDVKIRIPKLKKVK